MPARTDIFQKEPIKKDQNKSMKEKTKKAAAFAFSLSLFAGLLLASTQTWAQTGLNKEVSISFNHEKMDAALKKLEEASGMTFGYDARIANRYTAPQTQFEKQPVNSILDTLLRGTPLTYKTINGYVVITAKDPGKITGKIIDEENGQPVAGATIRIGNKGVISGLDGSFTLSLPRGSYTATVSYVGYGTKNVTEIEVRDNEVFPLHITLKREKGQMTSVVVTASARKESTAAFYTRQKNAATVTDGISYEQLNRLPDNNVGAVLKRISGVSVVDNKYVVVRGLSERYNQAMLDGMVLPSTDANKRNFAFDLIPNEMVGEIVVNKTASPDLSAEFVGGQILVKTLDIPVRNFTTIGIGASSNSQTLGKDFYSLGKRQTTDYLAIEGGNRKIPANTVSWAMHSTQHEDPTEIVTGSGGYKYGYEGAIEQSKRFNPDGFKLYRDKAGITPNMKFILGRVYTIDTAGNRRFGFTAGLTYRHRMQIDNYESIRQLVVPEDFLKVKDSVTKGSIYNFNTTATALLNTGFSSNRHKVIFRNIYSRTLEEDYNRSLGFPEDMYNGRILSSLVVPVSTSIRQHKLEGEHRLNRRGLLLNWMAGFAGINQNYNDVRNFAYSRTNEAFGDYYQTSNPMSNATSQSGWTWPYRMWSTVKQTDYTWGVDVTQPFKLLQGNSLIKIGYSGWDKKRSQDMHVFKLYTVYRGIDIDYLPFHILMDADHVGTAKGQAYYWADIENGDKAASTSEYHAGYLMLDQKFLDNKIRLVYGLRAENFGLANAQLDEVRRRQQMQLENPNTTYVGTFPELTGEKNWKFLPSANLTYSITSKINLRAAYSQTMIRPTFRETSVTSFPDPMVPAIVRGGNISSTMIKNADLRFEWYPRPGDMLSVSVFRKKMDKPVELVVRSLNTSPISMEYRNQHAATSEGIEMEFRKNLSFINPLIKHFTVYGNGAVFASKVITINEVEDPANPQKRVEVLAELDRPLVGQSPYLINLGLLYDAAAFSTNLVFNRTGYRPFFAVDGMPHSSEFRGAYSQLDLQVSKKLLRKKAEFKLNITNLLNNEEFYYQNVKGYRAGWINGEYQIVKMKYYVPGGSYFPPANNLGDAAYSQFVKLKNNYSESHGDKKTFSIKRGVNISLSFTYNF